MHVIPIDAGVLGLVFVLYLSFESCLQAFHCDFVVFTASNLNQFIIIATFVVSLERIFDRLEVGYFSFQER